MSIVATIMPEPKVGQDAVLHVEITTRRVRAPNTTAMITLSPGIELVEGALVWQGDIEADQTAAFDVTIRVTEEGEWPISVNAFSSVTGGATGFGAGKDLYMRSSTDSAEVIEDIEYPFPTPPVFVTVVAPTETAASAIVRGQEAKRK